MPRGSRSCRPSRSRRSTSARSSASSTPASTSPRTCRPIALKAPSSAASSPISSSAAATTRTARAAARLPHATAQRWHPSRPPFPETTTAWQASCRGSGSCRCGSCARTRSRLTERCIARVSGCVRNTASGGRSRLRCSLWHANASWGTLRALRFGITWALSMRQAFLSSRRPEITEETDSRLRPTSPVLSRSALRTLPRAATAHIRLGRSDPWRPRAAALMEASDLRARAAPVAQPSTPHRSRRRSAR